MKIFEEQENRLKVGQEPDDFPIGNDLFLSKLKGSPIFLVFWKTLWTRCQQEAPVIEKEIWQRFKDKGLRVYALGVKENSEQASLWISQHNLTYPVITDPTGEIYKRFGTGSVPYHVLLNKTLIIHLSDEKFDKTGIIQILDDHLKKET